MPKHIYKKTDKGLEKVGILPSLTEWNGKSNVGHTHAISDVTNLQSTLNGKANSSHTHAISQVTNLQSTLDNKINKNSVIRGGAIDPHPENGGILIGYYTNDLAFLSERGGSFVLTNTTQNKVIDNVTAWQSSGNMFDGSPSYRNLPTFSTSNDILTLIVKSPTQYSYSNIVGIGFGNVGWSAKNIKIELGYSKTNKGSAQTPDTDIIWKTVTDTKNYTEGLFYCNGAGASTAEGGSANNSVTWQYMRYTLTNWHGVNGRIAQVFSVNFGSKGRHNSFVSRNGGSIYGSLNVSGGIKVGNHAVKYEGQAASKSQTGISVSVSASKPTFTGTSHGHTITDNGHHHSYQKATSANFTGTAHGHTATDSGHTHKYSEVTKIDLTNPVHTHEATDSGHAHSYVKTTGATFAGTAFNITHKTYSLNYNSSTYTLKLGSATGTSSVTPAGSITLKTENATTGSGKASVTLTKVAQNTAVSKIWMIDTESGIGKANVSVSNATAGGNVSLGYTATDTGSSSTGITLANTTAGGSVSAPTCTATVTDNGHTHTL